MQASESINTCSRCIIPESFPNVAFDENHLCSVCRGYAPVVPRGEDELKKKLASRRGETYDLVVPFSGGKDSTYILWYAKERLQARVIAVNYDSGLQADLAKENMRKACDALEVPLVVKTVDYERQIAMLRSLLRMGGDADGFFLLPCTNCEIGIHSSAVSVAVEHDIPFILHGEDPFKTSDYMAAFLGVRRLYSNLRNNKTATPRVTYHLITYLVRLTLQRREMGLSLRQSMPMAKPYSAQEKVELVHFYQYVPWNPYKAMSIVKDAVGWKAPKDKDARFDCKVHCLVNYHWVREAGISQDGFVQAYHLRSGLINREKAVADEAHVQNKVEEECRSLIKELGLDDSQIPV